MIRMLRTCCAGMSRTQPVPGLPCRSQPRTPGWGQVRPIERMFWRSGASSVSTVGSWALYQLQPTPNLFALRGSFIHFDRWRPFKALCVPSEVLRPCKDSVWSPRGWPCPRQPHPAHLGAFSFLCWSLGLLPQISRIGPDTSLCCLKPQALWQKRSSCSFDCPFKAADGCWFQKGPPTLCPSPVASCSHDELVGQCLEPCPR